MVSNSPTDPVTGTDATPNTNPQPPEPVTLPGTTLPEEPVVEPESTPEPATEPAEEPAPESPKV